MDWKGEAVMNKRKKLPIGIESFEEMRKEDFYYVDKTRWIEQLLAQWGKVNLFTRPRWFGKSLNMSMLQTFFEVGADASLFDGLYISKNKEVCKQYLGKFPVVSISLKGVNGNTFDEARSCLVKVINREARRLQNLSESEKLTQVDKELFEKLLSQMKDDGTLSSSLLELSELLEKHYEEKVIVLIDEYDVPLAKANENGYYDEMVLLIRNLFENVLKTNHSLKFAVLTGCLRVAKESIFTGLNNFKVYSITDVDFDENFGFTDDEVKELLHYYGQDTHYETVKEWYDGYNFGEIDVYCPWDVMNYVRDLRIDPDMKPASYWKNTSDNAIIRSFIDYAGSGIQKKMEKLMAGDTIDQKIEENLTYDYLHSSEENFWSILYLTGYLTRDKEEKESADGKITLKIPNKEIREIFETTVQDWFSDTAKLQDRKHLFDAVWNCDEQTLTQEISRLLRITISYHDYREDFYHAFLAGIFAGAGYSVESNKEHGEGRSDLVIFNEHEGKVAVFEAKYSKEVKKLEEDCEKAIQQIDHRMYAKKFEDSYDEVICYGISFYKKRCVVKRDVK